MTIDKNGKIKDFAIFILSHNRADRVATYKTLQKQGNKQDIYIVIDDKDKEIEKYIKNFGRDKVIIFNKAKLRGTFDMMDNDRDDKVVVFARNEVYNIAKKLGLNYFLVLDDDYKVFCYRMNGKGEYCKKGKKIKNINRFIIKMVEIFKKMPKKVVTLSIAQGGDFIGGVKGSLANSMEIKRKAMNWFLCAVDRPIEFIGRLNEDTNTYTSFGKKGFIFLTLPYISLEQETTQKNKGGLTDSYLENGTYMKSFYSVLDNPIAVKLIRMGNKYKRIHHKVNWKYCVPKIISK